MTQQKNLLKPFLALILAVTFLSFYGCDKPKKQMKATHADKIQVEGAWARSAMMGMNGAAYMKLNNASAQDDQLLSASSSVANAVEIHEVVTEDGMMVMRPVKHVSLAKGGTAELKPGGYHIMLIGLNRDLKPSEKVDLELTFKNASPVKLEAPVKEAAMNMQMNHDMGNKSMQMDKSMGSDKKPMQDMSGQHQGMK